MEDPDKLPFLDRLTDVIHVLHDPYSMYSILDFVMTLWHQTFWQLLMICLIYQKFSPPRIYTKYVWSYLKVMQMVKKFVLLWLC